jgi:HK97 family phage major capsid protein
MMGRNLFAFAALAALVCLVFFAVIDPAAAYVLAGHHDPHMLFGAMTALPFASDLRGSTALRSPRGIRSVRADATPSLADIKALIDGLQKNFEDFKKENDAALKAATKDVVQTEKVDRINAAIEKQQKAVEDLSAQFAAARVGGGGDKNAPSAEAKAHSAAFNTFFRKGVETGLRDAEVKASLSVGSDPDGGFLVPRETETQIDRVLAAVTAMRGLASVITISGEGYRKPVSQGGATAGWVGETGARAQTTAPNLSMLEFPTFELYAMPAATQKLLDDAAIDITSWLGGEVAITFGEKEGAAFISGDGTSAPQGILSYTTIANANYAWGKLGFIKTTAAADFAAANPADNLVDLQNALKTGYQSNATFLMTRTTQSAVRKFKDGVGLYIWQPGLQLGQPSSIFGKPIATDDNMDELGANKYPIAYGDFRRGYVIVDRIGVRVLRDPFTAKPYVLFYTTKRVGGGVQNFEAIKLLKCSA